MNKKETFLSKVVHDVLQSNITVENLVFVLPSQRAGVFLKEELKNQINKVSFFPQIITINNFSQQLADLKAIDSIQQLFEFYAIYKVNTPKDKVESFDVFSQWARTLMQDFNDIDAYLLDTEPFFSTLKDVNRLNKWFLNDEEPSKMSKEYVSFNKDIQTYYHRFYEYLLSNKIGYQGLIYREAVSNIEHFIKTNKSVYVFVGFNALNKAEEVIIQTLLQNDCAQAYWDVDTTQNNNSHSFINSYKENWKYYKNNPFLWDKKIETQQEVTFVGAAKNITQFKYVGELLSKLKSQKNTAFVLANESLLPLALNSLPNEVKSINVTMGFPLEQTPLKSLFGLLFKLFINQEKFEHKEPNQFYFKDIINLFNHSYILKLFNDSETKSISNMLLTIQKKNLFFLKFKDLQNLDDWETLSSKISILLTPITTVANFLEKCFVLIELLKEKVVGIEKEILLKFYTVFHQLENLDLKYKNFESLSILYSFFKQLTQKEQLSFHGEPLEGLQLMGMLETRALDFETVIITSVNEGILPVGKTTNSFIPFDIKKYFKLPTYHDKDAIFSYHFFRLLKRAKHVFLIYNTETDDFGSGEKSRFLSQITLSNKNVKQLYITSGSEKTEKTPISIKKSETIMQTLKDFAQSGVSPSALANYLYNPLLFYFQKVLKINETNQAEETIAANTLGNVIHDTLDFLYKPYKGQFLTVSDMVLMNNQVESLISKFFKKHYENGDINIGKNKLIVAVATNFIRRFLNKEQQELKQGKELKIIATELYLEHTILIKGLESSIKIKGIVDRVDELDGVTRIIDYKTGLVNQSDLKINDFSFIHQDYKYSKAMQLLLYSYLYTMNDNYNPETLLEAGIISFKNLKSGLLKLNFGEARKKDHEITSEKLKAFMQELKILILEIFDQNTPFEENQK